MGAVLGFLGLGKIAWAAAAALAVVAGGLWIAGQVKDTAIARLETDKVTLRANYSTVRAAHEETLAAVDHIKAAQAQAARVRGQLEKDLTHARKKIQTAQRAVQAAPAAAPGCGLPPQLLALADGLRRPAAPRAGGGARDPVLPGRTAARIAGALP